MNRLDGFNIAADAIVQRSSEDPDIRADNRCRNIGEVHFCAAGRMSLGYEGISDTNSTGVGILFLTRRGGDVGLSIALTPKAMRSLAASLERMASDVEDLAATAATVALQKAAGK